MWWCFANPRVTLLADGTKEVRTAINRWRQTDISNDHLKASRLSGGLLAIQAYRGTICAVDPSYVLHKINGVNPPLVDVATRALTTLIEAIQPIVERLHPRDLEVSLTLYSGTRAGTGSAYSPKTETDIDLALESAVAGERIAVEVKARASISDYQEYSARYAAMVASIVCTSSLTRSYRSSKGRTRAPVARASSSGEVAASQNARCTAD